MALAGVPMISFFACATEARTDLAGGDPSPCDREKHPVASSSAARREGMRVMAIPRNARQQTTGKLVVGQTVEIAVTVDAAADGAKAAEQIRAALKKHEAVRDVVGPLPSLTYEVVDLGDGSRKTVPVNSVTPEALARSLFERDYGAMASRRGEEGFPGGIGAKEALRRMWDGREDLRDEYLWLAAVLLVRAREEWS